MHYKIFQIDAFTSELFGGNPAAVVPLSEWLPDRTMQLLARENNLAETAFFVPLDQSDCYHLRWFTPTTEVDLCGHATLATAFVIFNCLKTAQSDRLSFQSRSGWLYVTRKDEQFTLDFPVDTLEPSALPDPARTALNRLPVEVWKGREDYLLVYPTEADVLALAPNFKELAKVPMRGFIATAPGTQSDFVSRCFFPAFGIDEDPVTGSAHTSSTPYWAAKLGKNRLSAIQASARRGYLQCTLQGERVLISGQGRLYLEGMFVIE